jgi:excisionase family DNA binding protein
MTERNRVFTTFQAAEYCQVSPFTIRNWIESGVLPAYKTPGGHRRILRRDLDDFLRRHGMPAAEEIASSAKKILVVDDDKAVTQLVKKIIGQIDSEIEVAIALDGFEAGSLVSSFHPAVVVLDLKMPGLDGFQVCERIKKSRATANTTVIGITGYYSPEYDARFKDCGGWQLLKKPLDVDRLIAAIKEALRGVRTGGGAPTRR